MEKNISRSWRSVLDTTSKIFNVIMFGSVLRLVGVLLVSYTNEIDGHNIIEILLKVVLNTIDLTMKKKKKNCLHLFVLPEYMVFNLIIDIYLVLLDDSDCGYRDEWS